MIKSPDPFMVSKLCQKQRGGEVTCYNDFLLSQVKENVQTFEDQDGKRYMKQRRPKSCGDPANHRSSSTASNRSSRQHKNINTRSFVNHATRYNNWLSEQAVKEVQERSDSESRGASRIFNDLLQSEQTIVKDTNDLLNYKSMLQLRRKELLHKKWVDNVYEPLRKKIMEEMDGVNWSEMDRRKRELHKQFLEYRNKKGFAFLDTLDPSEYYSMALSGYRPASLKVQMKKLKDPLLAQQVQRCDEDRTILRCLTGSQFTDKDIEQVKLPLLPLVPLGRQGTDCSTWMNMHLTDVESGYRTTTRRRMTGQASRTSMNFFGWDGCRHSSADNRPGSEIKTPAKSSSTESTSKSDGDKSPPEASEDSLKAAASEPIGTKPEGTCRHDVLYGKLNNVVQATQYLGMITNQGDRSARNSVLPNLVGGTKPGPSKTDDMFSKLGNAVHISYYLGNLATPAPTAPSSQRSVFGQSSNIETNNVRSNISQVVNKQASTEKGGNMLGKFGNVTNVLQVGQYLGVLGSAGTNRNIMEGGRNIMGVPRSESPIKS